VVVAAYIVGVNAGVAVVVDEDEFLFCETKLVI
jgi:hypothetical protein